MERRGRPCERRGLKPSDLDFHPLSWLVYEYIQQGRFDRARGALKPLEDALAADPKPWMKNELATWRAYYIVGSERWAEVAGRQAFDNADELFAMGYAAARTRDLAKARATLDVMKKVAATEKEPSRRALAAIMERQLTAATSAATGALDAALAAAACRCGARRQDATSTGRPHPIKSSHELWGELLLQAKRPAEAPRPTVRARTHTDAEPEPCGPRSGTRSSEERRSGEEPRRVQAVSGELAAGRPGTPGGG